MHPSSRFRPRVLSAAVVLPILALFLSSCAQDQGASSAGGSGHYPITVSSCGEDITFVQEPQRIVLLKSASVSALHELGVLDRVQAKAGAYPVEAYDEDLREEVEAIPSLGGDVDSSGHLSVSQEAVMAQEPDVVMGQAENLEAAALSSVGISLLEEPALCPGGLEDPGFDDVYAQLRLYGKVFDRQEEAEESIGELEDRVAAVEQRVSDADQEEPLTAAVLYPTVGGGTTYAYGARSMAAPQLEAAGLENVFADLDERVAEVSPEELAGRDPDVLILLYSEGDPGSVEDSIAEIPGTDGISAVLEDRILAMPMNMTEPATPQAVDGLERIVGEFQQ